LTIPLTGTPQHKGPALPAPCISTSDTMDAPSIILSTFLPPEGAEADTEKDHDAVARQGIGLLSAVAIILGQPRDCVHRGMTHMMRTTVGLS
jgi:hypothetical protein